MDKRLINRFDYDGDYGTVLNRFLMQVAIGHSNSTWLRRTNACLYSHSGYGQVYRAGHH